MDIKKTMFRRCHIIVFLGYLLFFICCSGYAESRFHVLSHQTFAKADKVYIIQDLHADEHSQTSIAQLIAQIAAQHPAQTINVYREGAQGIILCEWFRAYPDKKAQQIAADYFMKTGKISGAEYTAITHASPLYLYGIDNAELYRANLDALNRYLTQKDTFHTYSEKLSTIIETLAAASPNRAIQSLLQLQQNAPTLNPLDYYSQLHDIYSELGVTFSDDSTLRQLKQSYNAITSANTSIIESQKLLVLKALFGDKKALTIFTEIHTETDYIDLYSQYLDKKVDPAALVELKIYLDAHASLDRLDAGKLVEEKFFYARHILENQTTRETNLFVAILCLPLIAHYFDCTLTRQEYDFLTHVFSEKIFNGLITEFPQLSLLNTVKTDLSTDNFYQSTLARDAVLAENILRQVEQFPHAVHIAVVGGFHTQGIAEFFIKQSISYETLLPVIDRSIDGYAEKYYSLLGIRNQTAAQNSLMEKLYATFNTPLQYLAIPTYLKHILSQTASENFVFEAQFLMQSLHAFAEGHDVSQGAYPFKTMRFLDPILVNEEKFFPVIFDTLTVPPLFVRIAQNAAADFGTATVPLHTTSTGDYHIAVVGPEWLKNIFSVSDAVISIELISYDSQITLAQATAPYLELYSGIPQIVEKSFAKFDKNLHFRKYGVDMPVDTIQGLLAPTTAGLYRNGTSLLGTLHKSGTTADKSTLFRLRNQLNQMTQEWITLYDQQLSAVQKQTFLQAVSYLFTLRSNRTLKNSTDFSIAYRGLDEQSGDRHLRYFEHLTPADMRGLLQELFAEITGITDNPFSQINTESLIQGLDKTAQFFAQNARDANLETLIALAPQIDAAILAPETPIDNPALFLSEHSTSLALNDTDRLYAGITDTNLPYGIYPDTPEHLAYDLKVFGENALVERLRAFAVQNDIIFPEELSAQSLAQFLRTHPQVISAIAPVSVFVKENSVMQDASLEHIETLINDPFFALLKVLNQYGLFRVQSHNALSEGISLPQTSETTQTALRELHDANGFIITRGETNYFSVNLMNIDSFRLLTVRDNAVSEYLTTDIGASIAQFVPAGLAPVIGYGFIQQTASDFSAVLRSPEYASLLAKYKGDEQQTLDAIRTDFQKSYLPISRIVESLLDRELYDYGIVRAQRSIERLSDGKTILVNRVHLPGSGNIKIDIWRAESESGDSLHDIQAKYAERYPKRRVLLMTNGGFFITSTLINRQNLPPEVLGTTLGLSMRNGRILSPPLFNKTALFQTTDGTVFLRKATINQHGGIWSRSTSRQAGFFWKDDTINLPESTLLEQHESLATAVLLYTPMFDHEFLPESALKDRVIIQIAGNTIANVVANPLEQKHLFAGITLAVPEKLFERYADYYTPGATVDFSLNFDFDTSNIQSALEAGPGLLHDRHPLFEAGTKKINLTGSGWLTKNSQKTQESRVHDMTMRYSRTAIGLRGDELVVVAVDGRIQESSGVTHGEMAEILQQSGVEEGFALDGGGSVALFLPQLNDPAFNNNAWNPHNATDEAPLDERRKSMVRPLSTAVIYYIDEDQLPKQPSQRSITPGFLNPIEQSL